MTYFEAESMRQDFNVAIKFKDIEPDRFKDVAKKYTADQWVECGIAIIKKLEDDKLHLFELLALVEAVRTEG
jgi:hypothetical protein